MTEYHKKETEDNALDKNDDLAGLKSALQKERQNARELAKQLEAFTKAGVDLDEYQQLKKTKEDSEKQKLIEQGKFKELEQSLLNQFAEKEKSYKQAIEELTKSERDARINTALAHSLNNAGVTSEGFELLVERLQKRVTVESAGGARVIKVLAEDGKSPLIGDNGEATIDDLIKDTVKKYPSLFKSEMKSGGGKPPMNAAGSAKSLTREQFNNLPAKEKAKFFNSGGIVS